MKVAFITNIAAHFHKKTFEEFAKNHDVVFYFFSEGNESWIEKRNTVSMGRFVWKRTRGISLTSTIRINVPLVIELLKGKYDVIIQSINGRFELLASFIIAKARGIPFILWTNLWFHPQTFFHFLTFPLVRLIYRKSDAIVTYGYHVDGYLTGLGVDRAKLFHSWNVTDNSLFNKHVTDAEKKELLDRYRIAGKRVALFVGRLSEEKGLTYLLEAFSTLDPGISAQLVLVGGGPQESLLKARVSEAKMK
ncbi:MAG TPA: glycosyltransferase, partial [Bacteroidota bacterium]|nr:glycosyltransferase [Bacteroidota bacterium]